MEITNYLCHIPYDTLLMMSDGKTFKKIQDIKYNEQIMTFNPDTFKYNKPVNISNKFKKMSGKLYQVEDSSGLQIQITDEQLILAEWKFNVPFLCPSDKIIQGNVIYSLCKERGTIVLSVIKKIYQVENKMVCYFTCTNNTFVTPSLVISNGKPEIFSIH